MRWRLNNIGISLLCIFAVFFESNLQAVEIFSVYTYDKLNRLTSSSFSKDSGVDTLSYTYDALGNITEYSVVNGTDTDGDGLLDSMEKLDTVCSDFNDADTDDDGLLDGEEDINRNGVLDDGETDPCDSDSDNDGIQDGTESGLTAEMIGADTDTSVFQADSDPSSTTDPLSPDSDADDWDDGVEDANGNGRVDEGESDPADVNSGYAAVGDINRDAGVDLKDAMLGLKIAVKAETSEKVSSLADIGSDGLIGVEESIYALRLAASVESGGDVEESGEALYVADAEAGVVHKLNTDGTYIKSIGDGELTKPNHCLMDAKGNLLVSDMGNIKVYVNEAYDQTFGDGRFLTQDDSIRMTIDSDGNIYAAQRGTGVIVVFDADYEYVTIFDYRNILGGSYEGPQGICYDGTNDSLVFSTHWASSGDKKQYEIDTNGNVLRDFGLSWYSCYECVFDQDGTLYLRDLTSGIKGIRIYDSEKSQIKVWLQNQLSTGYGMDFDGQNRIYVISDPTTINVYDNTDTETASLTITNENFVSIAGLTVAEANPGPPIFEAYSEDPVPWSYGAPRFILKDDGEYKIYYENYSTFRKYGSNLALSPDGFNWTDSTHNVIDSSVTGRTFNYGLSVMNDDGQYKAWVSTSNDWTAIRYDVIYYLTSSDGEGWTSQGSALSYGDNYDSSHADSPNVVKDDGVYHMYYVGAIDQNHVNNRIIHATSTDGKNWTKHGPIFDTWGKNPRVIISGGKWEMFFSGDDDEDGTNEICYAVSSDGYSWIRLGKVTSLPEGVSIQHVLKDGDGYELWLYSDGNRYYTGRK